MFGEGNGAGFSGQPAAVSHSTRSSTLFAVTGHRSVMPYSNPLARDMLHAVPRSRFSMRRTPPSEELLPNWPHQEGCSSFDVFALSLAEFQTGGI